MQRGAQASQALHRIVIGMRKRQQLARGLAALELAVDLDLDLAVRHGGIHRQAKLLLDLVRILDHEAHGAGDPDQRKAQQQADDAARSEDDRFARRHRGAAYRCRVDDARVAHGARAGHSQLLGAVEQAGIERGGDLHVALEAQRRLLGIGQAGDVLVQPARRPRRRPICASTAMTCGCSAVKRWRSSSRFAAGRRSRYPPKRPSRARSASRW